MQQKKYFVKSYSFIMKKVWYHQIWIQNYVDFIVSDLMFTAIDTVDIFVLHLLFLCFVANPGSLDVCEKVQRYVVGIKVYK